MYNRIIKFINSNSILYNHQYGFRKKHNTTHPILQFLHKIDKVNNKSEPEVTLSVFIDLKKGFHTINHEIILNKIKHYGMHSVIYNWIKNYLFERKQLVCYNGQLSSIQKIAESLKAQF